MRSQPRYLGVSVQALEARVFLNASNMKVILLREDDCAHTVICSLFLLGAREDQLSLKNRGGAGWCVWHEWVMENWISPCSPIIHYIMTTCLILSVIWLVCKNAQINGVCQSYDHLHVCPSRNSIFQQEEQLLTSSPSGFNVMADQCVFLSSASLCSPSLYLIWMLSQLLSLKTMFFLYLPLNLLEIKAHFLSKSIKNNNTNIPMWH